MPPAEPRAYPLLFGGEQHEPELGHYDVINPATEEVVGRAPEASVAQVAEAARAAREGQRSWSRTSPEERAGVLARAADILAAKSAQVATLAQAETGATMGVAKALQVGVTVARLRRYAAGALEPTDEPIAPQVTAPTALAAGGLVNAIAVRHPVGVVTCITSYNNPLANTAGKVAPALAMGNSVLVKPAPQNPLAVFELAEVFAEAGLPPGAFNVVTGSGPEVGQAACEAPEVNMVSFTGSTSVGTRIAEGAGRQMKRQLMELGGKGAALVFDDANLKAAAGGIGSVFTFYSGQICTAPTRVLAQRGIYDELIGRLGGLAGALQVGDPLDPATVVGPVISAAHRERVEGYVAAGRDGGAELVAGGERPDIDRGFYVAPTLLAGCRNDMRVAQEEIFGPVIVVIPFDEEEEAIALANDSMFGLMDYVFSADTARAYRVARRLEAGGVGVNTVGRNMEAPFGGFKYSGVGRDCGSYALEAYSELQGSVWPS